jgi:hypothetical protein
MRLSTIVKSEKKNPDLQSQLNIAELLQSVNHPEELESGEQSLSDISKEIVDVLREYVDNNIVSLLCEKLIDYKYIDKVYQLKFGRVLRWMPIEGLQDSFDRGEDVEPSTKGMMKTGGVLVKVIFNDSGTNLLLRHYNRFSQIRMNENLIFQRLSHDEKIVMGCRDLINNI